MIWCALNDKQKYHQNQQISASLIVHVFVLESESSVLGIALCSIKTLKYAVLIWKNATCTWSCFFQQWWWICTTNQPFPIVVLMNRMIEGRYRVCKCGGENQLMHMNTQLKLIFILHHTNQMNQSITSKTGEWSRKQRP